MSGGAFLRQNRAQLAEKLSRLRTSLEFTFTEPFLRANAKHPPFRQSEPFFGPRYLETLHR